MGADCECERVVTESLEANSSAASTDHRACSRATRKSLEPPVKLINCHNTLSPCLVCFLSSKHGIHLKSFLFDKCNPVRVYLYCIHTVQCCIAEIALMSSVKQQCYASSKLSPTRAGKFKMCHCVWRGQRKMAIRSWCRQG